MSPLGCDGGTGRRGRTLCVDKTGTLTQNKLTLGDPFCRERGYDAEDADPRRVAGFAGREPAIPIDLAVLFEPA